MNKFLILVFLLQTSNTMLQAQSKKQQLEILAFKLDSVNRICSQRQSQIATMATVLSKEQNENIGLKTKITELTRLNGILKDSLKYSRFQITSFEQQLDSLKNNLFGMSIPSVSDEKLVKFIEIDSWCSTINSNPIDQYFAMISNRELGMTIRFHPGTKKVALITIGASACGDCWGRYRFYFDKYSNLIREEYDEGCATEEPGNVSLFISTSIHNEHFENLPISIISCYNATGPMIPEYLYTEVSAAKSGIIAKSWNKIEAFSVAEFLVFECINM